MITNQILRIISRNFLNLITRDDKLRLDDIKWVKGNQGVFPTKFIKESGTSKEVPYLNTDLLVTFDVLMRSNIGTEKNNEGVTSILPFELQVNIYGQEAHDEIQFMIMNLYSNETKRYLYDHKLSLEYEPTEFHYLDGLENGRWYTRRSFSFDMNIEQNILFEKDHIDTRIDNIEIEFENIEIIGGER